MAPYSDYYDPVALPSPITPTASPHLSMWSKRFSSRKLHNVSSKVIWVKKVCSHLVIYECCGEVHHKIMRISASTCYRSESIILYHGFSQMETSFYLMHDMIEWKKHWSHLTTSRNTTILNQTPRPDSERLPTPSPPSAWNLTCWRVGIYYALSTYV